MPEKIVVTGMGLVSALGVGKDATLEALRARRSGLGRMKYLKTIHDGFPVGEVPMSNGEIELMLGIDAGVPTTRTSLMGMIALGEALRQAGADEVRPLRTAFISGTTVGGMDKSEQYYLDFLENDSRNEYIETHDCGACTRMIAGHYGTFDVMTTVSTACSSAANSIALGADMIKSGRVEMAVVGGSECLTKFHLNGFNTLMILDPRPCRPFDASRAGINLGEGAAYLVIETERSALARGADILCKLSGYANACDAYHQTASSPDGEGAFLAMKGALENSGLTPEDIDYINAHGTGTGNNDESEGKAIMRVFGAASVPPVSSVKGFTGHTTSASGSIEAIISIMALQNNFLPVNLNFREKIESLSFSPVTDEMPRGKIRHVLTNSFGFGGNNTACIFSKYPEGEI